MYLKKFVSSSSSLMKIPLFLLSIFLVLSVVVDAAWTTQFYNKKPAQIGEQLITGASKSSVVVRGTSPVRFRTNMKDDRSLFPGKCKSDQPDLPYGWETFKNEMMPRGSVQVDIISSGTRVRMSLFPRMGYSTNIPETITCGPLEDSDGKGYWLEEPPTADKSLTFIITNTNNINLQTFKKINQSLKIFDYTALNKEPDNSQEFEDTYRQEGLNLDIALINDVWIEEKIPDLVDFITCKPNDCLKGYITKKDLYYDTDLPNVVSVRVPRARMHNFNIDAISIISVQLSEPNKVFGAKGKSITQGAGTTSFKLMTIPAADPGQATPAASSPRVWINLADSFTNRGFPILNPVTVYKNTINVTEDCLRGKVTDEALCPRVLLFSVYDPGVGIQHRFAAQYHLYSDLQTYALTSSRGFPFADFEWVETYGFRVNTKKTQAIIQMKRMPEYETAQTDIITISLPFTCFTTLEPPVSGDGNPIRMVVTPSPGEFAGGLRDIEQKEIWFSNVVLYLVLDGESWKQVAVDTIVSLSSTGTFATGWNTQKMGLISTANGGNVTFNKTEQGRDNTTTIRITLAINPDYEMVGGEQETISFKINSTLVESGLALKPSVANTSFRIISSPGTYSMNAPMGSSIEELAVRAGGFTLELSLAGQKFVADVNDFTLCAVTLCSYWNSNSNDTAGWVAKRSLICNSNGITRVNNRTVRVVFAAAPGYNTIRGENITTLVPSVCTGGASPSERYYLNILPQNGNISFQVSTDKGATRQNKTELAESVVRMAIARMYISIVNDTWDDQNPNVTKEIRESLASTSNEPFGFNNKKAELIESVNIIDNARSVEIRFRVTTTYDITGNETLELQVPPSWVASGRAPRNPLITFNIYASAGSVTLNRWFGDPNGGNSIKTVTEDDISWGRVWFEFALLGDQWRRDVTPFVSSFSSDQKHLTNTSFGRLVAQLMPSINFFRFSLGSDGSEILRLDLQSSNLYDIYKIENVTLEFVAESVVSGIPPFFFIDGKQKDLHWFLVHPTPGRVILSGAVDNLNEKKMRQSAYLKIYLTLVGETWNLESADNTTSSLIENFNAIADPTKAGASLNPNGFLSFKASIISKSRVEFISPQTLLFHFLPNRNYEISTTEWLELIIPPYTVMSGLVPETWSRAGGNVDASLRLIIEPTGGELRIFPPDLVVKEEQFRNTNFTVIVAVDGDQWSQSAILESSVSFVASGFASMSSIIRESKGFDALKENFLNIGGGKRPFVSSGSSAGQESTLRVLLNPEPKYDINQDEKIRFSVTDPTYLSTGLLPEPASVEFTVKAKPQVIVLIIDQTIPKAIAYRKNLLRLKQELYALMGVPVERLHLELNYTSVRADGTLVVLLTFLKATTKSLQIADPRTLLELAETLLSIKPAYMFQQTAIRFAFPQDKPPAAAALIVHPPSTAAPPSGDGAGVDYSYVYAAIGAGFILVMALGFVYGLRLQRTRVAMSALKSSRQRRRDVGAIEFEDDQVSRREQAIELSVDPRLRQSGIVQTMNVKKKGTEYDCDNGPIVALPPGSLRDHVRQHLSLENPEQHVQKLKKNLHNATEDVKYDQGEKKQFVFRNRDELKKLERFMDVTMS